MTHKIENSLGLGFRSLAVSKKKGVDVCWKTLDNVLAH